MSTYSTRKSTMEGKRLTAERRAARNDKYGKGVAW